MQTSQIFFYASYAVLEKNPKHVDQGAHFIAAEMTLVQLEQLATRVEYAAEDLRRRRQHELKRGLEFHLGGQDDG
jgi:hypothetical protein